MLAEFLLRLVNRLQRRAGEFELAARLQADRAADGAIGAGQRDDVAVLADGVPAIAIVVGFEQRLDAAVAPIGHRRVVLDVETELLVLGADAPFVFGLRPGLQIGDEFIPRLDDGALGPADAVSYT